MKKIKSLSAMLISLLLSLFCILSPVNALAFNAYALENYDAHEYEQLRAFMEQSTAEGVKNGEQLSANYNANDPATWGGLRWNEPDANGIIHVNSVSFVEEFVPGCNLVGNLEITDFTKLEVINFYDNSLSSVVVSGCPKLDQVSATNNKLNVFSVTDCPVLRLLWCDKNYQLEQIDITNLPAMSQLICNDTLIDTLDVSAYPNLFLLHCHNTNISELNVSNNHQLREINIENTGITEIDLSLCPFLTDFFCNNTDISQFDVSVNPDMKRLFCNDTKISTLDLSSNHKITMLRCYNTLLTALDWNMPALSLHITLNAEENGFVGVDWIREYNSDTNSFENKVTAVAAPAENAEFSGWYNAAGELVSSDERYFLGLDTDIHTVTLTARFSSEDDPIVIPGDYDCNGAVNVQDAILTLRAAMGLITPSEQSLLNADMDGNGTLTVSDAITILRTAMGLI